MNYKNKLYNNNLYKLLSKIMRNSSEHNKINSSHCFFIDAFQHVSFYENWQKLNNQKIYLWNKHFDKIIWTNDFKEQSEELNINENNFCLYIWKMSKTNSWVYTQEVVLAALDFIFKRTKKWQKINVKLANSVSELINPDWYWSKKIFFTFCEQKKYLIKLVSEFFSNRIDDFNVQDVFEWHEKLKQEIINPDVPRVESWEIFSKTINEEKYLNEDFNSSDLFYELLIIYEKWSSPDFVKMIDSCMPKSMDKLIIWWKNIWIYTLTELSIRLYDYLKWINIQSWVKRQTKYDKIIQLILNPKYAKIPELARLQNFCNSYITKKYWTNYNFYTLYFDTQKSKDLFDLQYKVIGENVYKKINDSENESWIISDFISKTRLKIADILQKTSQKILKQEWLEFHKKL